MDIEKLLPTLSALKGLGFKQIEGGGNSDGVFMDSPKNDDYGMPVVQIWVYENCAGTVSVLADDSYGAPYLGDEAAFVEWLDKYFPGWK